MYFGFFLTKLANVLSCKTRIENPSSEFKNAEASLLITSSITTGNNIHVLNYSSNEVFFR